eukprot:SAG22_NODE_2673_length_2317_cov_2.330929_2_plen_188_part_01
MSRPDRTSNFEASFSNFNDFATPALPQLHARHCQCRMHAAACCPRLTRVTSSLDSDAHPGAGPPRRDVGRAPLAEQHAPTARADAQNGALEPAETHHWHSHLRPARNAAAGMLSRFKFELDEFESRRRFGRYQRRRGCCRHNTSRPRPAGQAVPGRQVHRVSHKALHPCCASTVFLSKTAPFLALVRP